MQDPEFEKQVRQKMDELKFSPAATVWTNVEKEINKDKKRRRPIIPFLLLTGLLLSGSLYLLFIKINDSGNVARKEDVTSKIKEETTDASSASHSNTTAQDQSKNKSLRQENPSGSKQGDNKKERPTKLTDKSIAINSLFSPKKTNKKQDPGTSGSIKENNQPNEMTENETVSDESKTAKKEVYKNLNRVEQKKSAIESILAVKTSDILSRKIKQNDIAATNTVATKQQQANKTKPWTLGLTSSAGISNIYEGFFGTSKVSNSANSFYTPSGAPGVYHVPSSVSSGFSFSAGIIVRKGISNTAAFSIGLNYHYYSTHIQTGSKIDSSAIAYYLSGSTNTYTNQYHFIETPVNFQLLLNQGKKIPMYWEAGLILSAMVGSNELHFDNMSGNYYKDKSSFNKVQLSASTALMIGWSLKKGLAFHAGPQFQYGMTGLVSNPSGSQQHLFFGGLKLDVLFPKKTNGMQR